MTAGNLIKYAKIANDLAQDDKTVKRYMEILELMFIIRRLHPYVRNSAKRAVVGMPKLYFIDTGLACHLLGLRKSDTLHTSQFFGGLVENFVFSELLKQEGAVLLRGYSTPFRINERTFQALPISSLL